MRRWLSDVVSIMTGHMADAYTRFKLKTPSARMQNLTI